MGICGATISKNLLNKKQKNLLYKLKLFWNQAWHGFWCRSYELCSAQSECKNEHLDSFWVVKLAFLYILCFYRTRYHGLTRVTMHVHCVKSVRIIDLKYRGNLECWIRGKIRSHDILACTAKQCKQTELLSERKSYEEKKYCSSNEIELFNQIVYIHYQNF